MALCARWELRRRRKQMSPSRRLVQLEFLRYNLGRKLMILNMLLLVATAAYAYLYVFAYGDQMETQTVVPRPPVVRQYLEGVPVRAVVLGIIVLVVACSVRMYDSSLCATLSMLTITFGGSFVIYGLFIELTVDGFNSQWLTIALPAGTVLCVCLFCANMQYRSAVLEAKRQLQVDLRDFDFSGLDAPTSAPAPPSYAAEAPRGHTVLDVGGGGVGGNDSDDVEAGAAAPPPPAYDAALALTQAAAQPSGPVLAPTEAIEVSQPVDMSLAAWNRASSGHSRQPSGQSSASEESLDSD